MEASSFRYGLGVISMLVSVVGWVAGLFVIQRISQDYSKPYFLSYVTTSSRILYLPIVMIWGDFLLEDKQGEKREQARWKYSLRIAAWMTPLQGLINFCNQVTFATLSISTGSILFNSNPFFLISIGWSLGWEQLSLFKLLAALIALSSLILLGSHELGRDLNWSGVLSSLGSALSFALICLLLKRNVKDLKQASMLEAYGIVGLLILLLGWPLLLVLHFSKVEIFSLPSMEMIPLIFISCLLGTFVFNLSWLIALAWTSEWVVSIGMALALPATFFADLLLNQEPIGWVKWVTLGGSMVAFALINLAIRKPEWDYLRNK